MFPLNPMTGKEVHKVYRNAMAILRAKGEVSGTCRWWEDGVFHSVNIGEPIKVPEGMISKLDGIRL